MFSFEDGLEIDALLPLSLLNADENSWEIVEVWLSTVISSDGNEDESETDDKFKFVLGSDEFVDVDIELDSIIPIWNYY